MTWLNMLWTRNLQIPVTLKSATKGCIYIQRSVYLWTSTMIIQQGSQNVYLCTLY